ncbi:cephalotoxin-like protein [Sander lucioperca]|uniref:Cephalotoxin-like protein n=1 Tax=Sander lucioperca TaxID=283035 RepID=A0A8C9Y6J3_SANLU|nr:cephalotoxin-like protein [Sander lucioperca]XP_035852541.1 cephalotoxin-like protein [Sander lucioperca]XP_035852542.1 cephalotoxin-like protein [Sander lucioperca]
MAFPRLSASMLLASLILLLYWTTSSAQSHDPTSSIVSPPYRVKRDQPFENREKVDKSLAVGNSFLTVVKDIFEMIEKTKTKELTGVMKSLANVAKLAPGVGGLVASVVNMVLIFIPQDDPVLNEVKKGFEEVNRKLDLLSIQISNLATDVEWFNYASVYSQDELRILNTWKKFNELLQKSQLVQNEEQKLRLAEIFVNYYENTGTEASVANLYHYLTVKDTSLSGNLNELLRKKFKCDFQEIGKYNVYFSRLMWQGMVLNQFYWKLIGLDSSGIEAKHTQMFKNVYEAQKSALDYCLDNHMQYVKEDVKEIRKGLSADNKQAIADKVKNALDKKYNWYNWVVLVYNTDQAHNYILYDLTKIIEHTITVAVGYTLKTDRTYDDFRRAANKCFESSKPCKSSIAQTCMYTAKVPPQGRPRGSKEVKPVPFGDIVKVTHAASGEKFAVAPAPFHQNKCFWYSQYYGQISIYQSVKESVCQSGTCSYRGTCKRLLDSNEWMCDCPDGYYGERCEKITPIGNATVVDIPVVPDISTIDTKMKMMEVKLENKLKKILNILNNKCRG